MSSRVARDSAGGSVLPGMLTCSISVTVNVLPALTGIAFAAMLNSGSVQLDGLRQAVASQERWLPNSAIQLRTCISEQLQVITTLCKPCHCMP